MAPPSPRKQPHPAVTEDAAAKDPPAAIAAPTAPSPLLPPPAKRVRREYPWRPEYVRDFGVRPIQFDAASGDALLIECLFCVCFGREAPAPGQTKPTVNKDGQPVKTRARTRNAAHWKYPFRTDNMRSHHLQQHAAKWTEYSALLEHAKQEQLAGGGSAGDAPPAESGAAQQRLDAFFGGRVDGDASPLVPTTPTVVVATRTPSRTLGNGTENGHDAARLRVAPTPDAFLLPTIANRAIVDAVLPVIVDIPRGLDHSEFQGDTKPLKAPGTATTQSDSNGYLAAASSKHASLVLQLLEAGLHFGQIAAVTRLTPSRDVRALGRSDVAGYARAVVASSLQLLSSLLTATWAYSLRLTVVAPTSASSPTALRLWMRVPVALSRDVGEFHVITVALRESAQSQEAAAHLLCLVLLSLDRNWQKKALNVTVNGATHCLGVHADIAQRVFAPLLEKPVVDGADGRQSVEHAIQIAWAQFRDERDGSEETTFAQWLLRLVAHVRCDGRSRDSHCPFVNVLDAWSVFQALRWLLERREELLKQDGVSVVPYWWWLTALVAVEAWTDCLAAKTRVSLADAAGAPAMPLLQTLMAKYGVDEISDGPEKESEVKATEGDRLDVTFDGKARTATLLPVATTDKDSEPRARCSWTSAAMATCFRSLNVSTRRAFSELSDKPLELVAAERSVSRFVLLLLGSLRSALAASANAAAKFDAPAQPPTLPLDFLKIEPAQVVDLVESHSRRLEAAFPTMFLDLVSREIRDLQSLLASSDQLRSDLERLQQQQPPSVATTAGEMTTPKTSVFAASWLLVPQFPAAWTLAAGFASAAAEPSPLSPLLAFGRVEDDAMGPHALADLAVEAHAHVQQLERLHDATPQPQDTETSLVV